MKTIPDFSGSNVVCASPLGLQVALVNFPCLHLLVLHPCEKVPRCLESYFLEPKSDLPLRIHRFVNIIALDAQKTMARVTKSGSGSAPNDAEN